MAALVEVRDLVKHYPIRSGIVFRHEIGAVKAVSYTHLTLPTTERV